MKNIWDNIYKKDTDRKLYRYIVPFTENEYKQLNIYTMKNFKFLLVLVFGFMMIANTTDAQNLYASNNDTRKSISHSNIPSDMELKARLIKELREIDPKNEDLNDSELWRFKIVPHSYTKIQSQEQFFWTLDGNTNSKGQYYQYYFRYTKITGEFPAYFPELLLDTTIKNK